MRKRPNHPPVVPAVAKRIRSPESLPSSSFSPPPLFPGGASSSTRAAAPSLTVSVPATAKVSSVTPVAAATVAVRVSPAADPAEVASLGESPPVDAKHGVRIHNPRNSLLEGTHSHPAGEVPTEDAGAGSSTTDTLHGERQLKSRPAPVRRPEWMAKFELLKKFVREYKHARVPTKLDTDEYPKLGQWVSVQRTAKRLEDKRKAGEHVKGKNRISDEQVALLQSTGFLWGATVTARSLKAWDAKFRLLQRYHELNGHTRVPKVLDSEEFPQLGHWVQRQRSAYANEQRIKAGKPLDKSNRKRITAEHIARLEALGFHWSVRSRHGSPRSSQLSHTNSPKSRSGGGSPALDQHSGLCSPLGSNADDGSSAGSAESLPPECAASAVASRLKGAAALTEDECSGARITAGPPAPIQRADR